MIGSMLNYIPSFAITINKSQGQSFDSVGVYLPQHVFSHGQLYVALSRTKYQRCLKLFIENSDSQGILIPHFANKVFTKNIVLKELLE